MTSDTKPSRGLVWFFLQKLQNVTALENDCAKHPNNEMEWNIPFCTPNFVFFDDHTTRTKIRPTWVHWWVGYSKTPSGVQIPQIQGRQEGLRLPLGSGQATGVFLTPEPLLLAASQALPGRHCFLSAICLELVARKVRPVNHRKARWQEHVAWIYCPVLPRTTHDSQISSQEPSFPQIGNLFSSWSKCVGFSWPTTSPQSFSTHCV